MSKALGVVLGLGAIGACFAFSQAKAAEPPPPMPEPEPEEPPTENDNPGPAMPPGPVVPTENPLPPLPTEPPAGPGNPPSGNGNNPMSGPTIEDAGLGTDQIQFLPPSILNLNLSGKERMHYAGQQAYGKELVQFHTYVVNDTLNGMDMYVFVNVDNHEEWISMFKHPDPAGSTPPFHFIVYQSSGGANELWMVQNIAGLDH